MDTKTAENLQKIKNNPSGELVFMAHFGNWELFTKIFEGLDVPVSGVYRAMNNQYVDDFILKMREKSNVELIPKGPKGIILDLFLNDDAIPNGNAIREPKNI